MRVIGLTGNIAAGKSAVAQRLRALGAPIVDADVLAREAVAPGSPALRAIAERFGPSVIASDSTLDRAAMRQLAFSDPDARLALNAIVHPEVERLRRRALAELEAAGTPLAICDIPLLFEAGLESSVDAIILVDAPDALRRERLVRDRGLTAAEAEAMMAAQMPSYSKRAGAQHVIDNIGTREELDAQVDALWVALNAKAS
jgi:dephospho-CoA kinase